MIDPTIQAAADAAGIPASAILAATANPNGVRSFLTATHYYHRPTFTGPFTKEPR